MHNKSATVPVTSTIPFVQNKKKSVTGKEVLLIKIRKRTFWGEKEKQNGGINTESSASEVTDSSRTLKRLIAMKEYLYITLESLGGGYVKRDFDFFWPISFWFISSGVRARNICAFYDVELFFLFLSCSNSFSFSFFFFLIFSVLPFGTIFMLRFCPFEWAESFRWKKETWKLFNL